MRPLHIGGAVIGLGRPCRVTPKPASVTTGTSTVVGSSFAQRTPTTR